MPTQTTQDQPQSLTASGAPWTPPRHVLAARSLAAVDRIADPEERYQAFARHMEQYPPTIFGRD